MIVETLLGGAGLAFIGLGWLKSRPLEPRYRIKDNSTKSDYPYEYALQRRTLFGWRKVMAEPVMSDHGPAIKKIRQALLSHRKRDIIFDSSQDSLEDLDTLFTEHLKG